VAVILTASTRILNLNTVRDCRCRVLSEMFSLPQNGPERNSESWLLFLFHGTEFRIDFSSAVRFVRKFREFASIFGPQNGIPSCFLFRGRVWNAIPRISVPRNSRNSVYSVFRGIIFLPEIPNPRRDTLATNFSIIFPFASGLRLPLQY
jgi:hypothetical protein